MREPPHRVLLASSLLVAAAQAGLTGCSSNGSFTPADAAAHDAHDSGVDATQSDGNPADAKRDTTQSDGPSSQDASQDASQDVARETSIDAGVDAPADAPSDAHLPSEAASDAPVDASFDAGDVNVIPRDASIANPCSLPGSVQFTSSGVVTVDGGGASAASLAFLHLPVGFCAHYFATVPDARQLRFAPGGELFVASPAAVTTGGNPSGAYNAIVILPDDNLDGVADTTLTFLKFGLGSMTQGMLFTPGYFYFQNGARPGTAIMRMPYGAGQREPGAPPVQVADVDGYTSTLHWPKALDIADDGTIYVGNGGDQQEACVSPHPVHGGIFKIDSVPDGGHPSGQEVAQGLRNPIAVRCLRGHNTCFGLELAKDYSADGGGREKMFLIHQGDDWGFPCCATQGLPYPGNEGTDCSTVTADTNSFLIGDTPFSLEFEPGKWPGMWAGRAYVATHGNAFTWGGARIVAIPMDPSTGLPTPSTDVNGTNVGMVDFATGWDDGTQGHGRPAALAMSPDGRLFVGNDNNGVIFWIAPM